MVCPKCSEKDILRRMPRVGILEEKVLTLMGYYPWECSGCRKRFMLKTRDGSGKAPRSAQPQLRTN